MGRLGIDPKQLEGRTRMVEVYNRCRVEEMDGLFLRRGAVGREVRVVEGENKDIDTAIWELPPLYVRWG